MAVVNTHVVTGMLTGRRAAIGANAGIERAETIVTVRTLVAVVVVTDIVAEREGVIRIDVSVRPNAVTTRIVMVTGAKGMDVVETTTGATPLGMVVAVTPIVRLEAIVLKAVASMRRAVRLSPPRSWAL